MVVAKKINFKAQAPKIILAVYLVLSILYITVDLYTKTKIFVYNKGVTVGQQQTVNSILERALDTSCSPFELYAGETRANLINVACLEQGQSQAQPQNQPIPPVAEIK